MPCLCLQWRTCSEQDLTRSDALQISYARQLITLEERNRVLGMMKRFRLPLWHSVCHTSLFWKVRSALYLAVESRRAKRCSTTLRSILR